MSKELQALLGKQQGCSEANEWASISGIQDYCQVSKKTKAATRLLDALAR